MPNPATHTEADTSLDFAVLSTINARTRHAEGIATITSFNPVTVRAVLRDLEQRGMIERVGTAGRYTLWDLTPTGRSQLDPDPNEAPAPVVLTDLDAAVLGIEVAPCSTCARLLAHTALVAGACRDCRLRDTPKTCSTCRLYTPSDRHPDVGTCGLYASPMMDGSHTKSPDHTCAQHRFSDTLR